MLTAPAWARFEKVLTWTTSNLKYTLRVTGTTTGGMGATATASEIRQAKKWFRSARR